MLFPKKTKYKKQFKGKLIGQTTKGSKLIFGFYGLKALKETRLTARQLEATRRTIMRKMKRMGFLWSRIFPDIPVTSKPTENRMGKGKGSVSFWIAKVKKGQILFELSGFSLKEAQKILTSGTKKLPITTKFVFK
jgi:large subunit ribosomal protein L16